MLRRHQPLPCNPQLVRAGADGSGEPALPMRQGALKDICATTAGIPPKAPSGALARWQPATFVQQEKAVLATASSLNKELHSGKDAAQTPCSASPP